MDGVESFQKQEGKKRKINNFRDPKSLKTYWIACIFGDRILKGMMQIKQRVEHLADFTFIHLPVSSITDLLQQGDNTEVSPEITEIST